MVKKSVKRLFPVLSAILLILVINGPAWALVSDIAPLDGGLLIRGDRPALAAALNIVFPSDNTVVNTETITVVGFVQNSSGVKIELTDSAGVKTSREVAIEERGHFRTEVTLSPGMNLIKITNQEGTAEQTLHVTYDDAPLITGLLPQNNTVTVSPDGTISGKVINGQSLYIGSDSVELDTEGNFSYPVELNPGYNDFTIMAEESFGIRTEKNLRLIYDNGQPIAVVTEDWPGAPVYQANPVIKGYVLNTTSLKINGQQISLVDQDGDGYKDFTYYSASLNPGVNNTIILEAANGVGSQLYNHTIFYQHMPDLYVFSPGNNSRHLTKGVNVRGYAVNTTRLSISLNGGAKNYVSLNEYGNFTYDLVLVPGNNIITVTAANGNGSVDKTIAVEYEGIPRLVIESPAIYTTVYSEVVLIKGTASQTQTLKINGNTVYLDSQGRFSSNVTLSPGNNFILLEAMDGSTVTTKYLTVKYENGPVIEIEKPLDQEKVDATAVIVKGRVLNIDSGGFTIESRDAQGELIAEAKIYPGSDGSFSKAVKLKTGANKITLKATKGNYTVTKVINVTSAGQPDLAVLSPADGDIVYSNLINISGSVKTGDKVEVKVNGVLVSLDSEGIFDYEYSLRPGNNTITIIAYQDKKTTKKVVKVYFSQLVKPGAYREAAVPANGGNSNFFDGIVVLNIPKGTFREDKKLGVKILEPKDYNAPNFREIVSPLVRIDLPGEPLNTTLLSVKFSGVIRKALYNNIALCYYDVNKGSWEPVGGKIDSKKGLVLAAVSKSGVYTAMVYYNSFNDIFNHWSREDIELLVARGIIKGTSSTTFEPDKKISRAEFAAMLVRALGIPLSNPEQASFSDVPSGHWGYQAIETAIRNGFILGTSATNFSPSANITREQAAVMLARSANLADIKEQQLDSILTKFNDIGNVSVYAKKGVAQAIKNKLLTGTGKGDFSPGSQTTRAQAAKMVVRLLSLMKKI